MINVITDYSFNASAKEITINIPGFISQRERVAKIVNLTTDVVIYDVAYNFASGFSTNNDIVCTTNKITFQGNNNNMQNTDKLHILYYFENVEINNLPANYPLPTTQQNILEKIRDSKEIFFEIQSSGQFQGKTAYVFHILGRRIAWVNTTAQHDLCEFLTSSAGQEIYTDVTIADALQIVSTSAQDTDNTGTGTWKVLITYLNNLGAISTHIANMNGTTPVSLSIQATAILWIEAVGGGSAETSQGTIVVRKASPLTIYEQITAGGNKSLSGRFKVPAGYTAYMCGWDVFGLSQNMDVKIRATVNTKDRTISNRYLFQDNMWVASNQNANEDLPFLKFPENCKIKLSAITAGTGGSPRCDASFTLILIQN